MKNIPQMAIATFIVVMATILANALFLLSDGSDISASGGTDYCERVALYAHTKHLTSPLGHADYKNVGCTVGEYYVAEIVSAHIHN